MRFTTTRRLIAAATLAAAITLPGCRESVGFVQPDPGNIVFTYEGHHTGAFTGSGALPQSPLWSDSYAAGYRDVEVRGGRPPAEYLVAVANSPRAEEGFTDFFWFLVERPSVGIFECETAESSACRVGALLLPNLDTRATTGSDAFYLLSGSVEVLTMTSSRATGTFTMVLENPVQGSEQITLSGSFDIPLVPPHYILG
jgi:hypothetical protein